MNRSLATPTAIAVLICLTCLSAWTGGEKEAGATKPETVTIWHHWASTNPQGQAFEKIVPEYNASQSGYNADALFMAGAAAAGGMIQKIMTAVAAGDPPDVATTNAFHVPKLTGADAIYSLEDLLPKDEVNTLKKDTNIMGNFFDIGGKRMAWLVNQKGAALCYNKTLFKEAGLDPAKGPDTWDQVIEFGKKLTKDTNADGMPDQFGWMMHSDIKQYTLIHWNYPLLAYGGQLMNDARTDVTFQEQPGIDALQLWVDTLHKYKISTLSPPPEAFLTGKMAMDIIEIHILAQRNKMDFEFGASELPKKKRRGFYTAGQSMVIFKKAKNPEGAVDFLRWFTSPEPSAKFAMLCAHFPARKSGIDLPFYQKYMKDNPGIIPFAKSLEYSFPKPNVIPFLGMQLEIAKQIERALYQRATPREALEEAAKVCRQKLKK